MTPVATMVCQAAVRRRGLREFTALVKKCIRDSVIDQCNVHEAALVSGFTRNHTVQEMIQDSIDGEDPNKCTNPAEAVVRQVHSSEHQAV